LVQAPSANFQSDTLRVESGPVGCGSTKFAIAMEEPAAKPSAPGPSPAGPGARVPSEFWKTAEKNVNADWPATDETTVT